MENKYEIPGQKKLIAVFYENADYAGALLIAEELRNDYRVSVMPKPKKFGKFLNKLEQQGFSGFAVYGQEDGVKFFEKDYNK